MITNKYKELVQNIKVDKRSSLNSILLIDGLNTFLRNFSTVNYLNPDGNHVGGLIGFLKSIGYAIRLSNPTKVVIVFDGIGSSNNKRNLYSEYKSNRNKSRITNYSIFSSKEEETESINNQMGRLIEYLKCLPVTIISIDNIEADDVIGYLVNKFEKFDETKEITIMSADRDFLQLVSNKTKVYSPSKKKIYTPIDVLNEYNISSYNFLSYKILLGDSADNVPGIFGLGPKKIIKLFPELSSDKNISLEDIIDISVKKINENKFYLSILERRKQLEINKKLMDLKNIFISNENKEIIKENFNSSYSLNSYFFHQLYNIDKLGDKIPNVDSWLNEVFGYLGLY